MFIGMATAEALILRPTNAKSQLIGKDLNAGKDRRENRAAEDETVGWHQATQWT